MFTAASANAEAVVFSRLLGTASPSEVSSIGPICSSTKRFICESEVISFPSEAAVSHSFRFPGESENDLTYVLNVANVAPPVEKMAVGHRRAAGKSGGGGRLAAFMARL
jgi:hypothetical protein